MIATTFFAPGQRFAQPSGPTWHPEHQVTVTKVALDPLGIPQVTFQGADGWEVTAYAEQVEAAVAAGELSPVNGFGLVPRC